MAGKTMKANDFNQINRLMGKPTGRSLKMLVNITNGKEVLRVSREKANKFFFTDQKADKATLSAKKLLGFAVDLKKGTYKKPTKIWVYTTKAVYKQYIESRIPGSKIPMPTFSYKKSVTNNEGKKELKSFLKNIYE